MRYSNPADFSLSGTTGLGGHDIVLDSKVYDLVMASTTPANMRWPGKEKGDQMGLASSTLWLQAKPDADVEYPLGRSVMAQLFRDENGAFLDFYTTNLTLDDAGSGSGDGLGDEADGTTGEVNRDHDQ